MAISLNKIKNNSKSDTAYLTFIIIALVAVLLIGTPCALYFGIDKSNYDTARTLEEGGQFSDALEYYGHVVVYGDKKVHIKSINEAIINDQTEESYMAASKYFSEQSWQSAINIYEKLGDYKDSADKLKQAKESKAAKEQAIEDAKKAKTEAEIAEQTRKDEEAKARLEADEADNAWKNVKYFVSAYSDAAICIRSSPNISGGKCNSSYYSDSGTNVINYIEKGSSQKLENLMERQKDSENHWWYKVRLGYSSQTGWVRDDVVKEY